MVVPGSPNIDGELDGTMDPTEPTRLVPTVCDTREWSTVTMETKALDLAVVPTSTGATILGVAREGGPVRGFRVDNRGLLVGDPAGTTVMEDASYSGLSAGVMDGQLAIGAVAGEHTTLALVSPDLTLRHDLAQLDGTLLGEVPVLPARDTRIAVVGGRGGITASTFDGALWSAAGSLSVTKSEIRSMTATPYLDDALIAWSTDDKRCHLKRFTSTETLELFSCDHVRIAIEARGGNAASGTLVYEEAGNVMRTQIEVVGTRSIIVDHTRVAAGARSPRVVFDGTRTWISYLDVHGNVIVGFLDGKGGLVTRALQGIQPQRDAYELAYFADAMWIVAVDDRGYGAQRLCATPL